jgi:hypothetical protein
MGEYKGQVAQVKPRDALRGVGAYKAFIFCQQNSDTGVDLANCERDEHRVWRVLELCLET